MEGLGQRAPTTDDGKVFDATMSTGTRARRSSGKQQQNQPRWIDDASGLFELAVVRVGVSCSRGPRRTPNEMLRLFD